jgi:hypothetical protein
MKVFEMKMRPIALLVVMWCLIGVGSQVAQAQTPTTGALLTINGTVTDGTNIMNVSLSISDKDIHSGTPQTVPIGGGSTCIAADQIATDAYVLQAGAPTGCDPGDIFEGSLADGVHSFSSEEGLVSYAFGVRTHYQCGPTLLGACNAASISNSRGTITSNDTGFMTVSNNGSSSFTGTITLAASSPSCGLVFDRFTGTLPGVEEDAPVVLALAQDSSGCGGFTSLSQTHTLEPGITTTYQVGADLHKVTPINNLGGESLTVTLVPVFESDFDAVRPADFPTESCIPFADLTQAAGGVHTCGEWQSFCTQGTASSNDCTTMVVVVVEDYGLPSDLPAIGGPDFLLKHLVGCPPPNNGFDMSIFLEYSVNPLDPGTKGSGIPSCYVVTHTPGAPPITSGTVTGAPSSKFVGFSAPVDDVELNQVKAGSTLPLKFSLNNPPITGLTLCPNTTGTGCTTPWVNFAVFPISCPNAAAVNTATDTTTLSVLSNSGLLDQGGGNYQLNWKTVKGWTGCATVVLTFDPTIGIAPVAPANFQFN